MKYCRQLWNCSWEGVGSSARSAGCMACMCTRCMGCLNSCDSCCQFVDEHGIVQALGAYTWGAAAVWV